MVKVNFFVFGEKSFRESFAITDQSIILGGVVMGKTIAKDIIILLITVIVVRGVFIYFTKDPFIDSGFIGTITGCVLGRVIVLKMKE